jgi:Rrf2 family protein
MARIGRLADISQEGFYALQAVVVLGYCYPKSASVRDICSGEHLPHTFLESILLKLTKCGIVESKRGCRGGYRLRHDPSQISLRRVLCAIDGRMALSMDPELLQAMSRSSQRSRPLYDLFLRLQSSVVNVLDNTTLGEIVAASHGQSEAHKTEWRNQEAVRSRS